MKKLPPDIQELVVLQDIDFRTHYQTLLLAQILAELRLIYRALAPITKIVITFQGAAPGAPATLSDIGTINATASEFDKTNQPAEVDKENLQWSVSDSSLCSVATNPDGSATFSPISPGPVIVTVVDTAVGIQAQDTLNIVHGPIGKLTIVFGTPH